MTELEKKAPFPSAMRLVDRMYFDIDSARYEAEANVGGVEEEYESESDLEEDAKDSIIQGQLVVSEPSSEALQNDEEATKTEKQDRTEFLIQQRTELCRIITERFLSGLDAAFDYSTIDRDPTFDDLVLESQRLSDAYFDEEDPST